MKPLLLATVGVGLAAGLLTGCASGTSSSKPSAPTGSTSTAASGSSVIVINATDSLRFEPSTIAVHGVTAKVKLVNNGSYPHNLQVPQLNYKSATVSGDPGSQSTTFTLHFSKPGTYPFVCTYHASAGMKGQFVVTK